MATLLTFDDALAEALDRCIRGETPEAVAQSYPDLDLLPYLQLAECLRGIGAVEPSREWLQRSLKRLLQRPRR